LGPPLTIYKHFYYYV